jgi:hypothetical protein
VADVNLRSRKEVGVQNCWPNAKVIVPIALAQTVVYLTINHCPLFTPRELPLTAIDKAIPFWPWTMWAYLGFIVGQMGLAIAVRDRALFRLALLAYGIAMGTTFLVHLFWPTRIERPDPAEDGTFQTWAFRVMLECDAPNSCFPSAHICGTVVIFWAYWRDGRWLGSWLLFFALPILTLSILTTKQHYFWDWLGGWAMGLLAIVAARLITGVLSLEERPNNA